MNERQAAVAKLCDGVKTSKQIAEILGESHKYVQEVALKFDLPRRKRGSAFGSLNGSYKSGRRIDRDGYAIVSAPPGHPYAVTRKDRNTGMIREHRLVMESVLGRYLEPQEVVDHIDGLHLHNCPSNLRVFASNAEHLHQTVKGRPKWSKSGQARFYKDAGQRINQTPVDTYRLRKRRGDVRLQQILLAALQLGIDSPYLLGTSHHLKKAGIFDFSRSSLEHALALLNQRYEQDLAR